MDEFREVLGAIHALGMRGVAKGVMHPADAAAIHATGCDGVMVSNIGVRQSYLWAPGPEQLRAIGEALAENAVILVDGGIRHAADIVAAHVLGADLSIVVRPVVHALAAGGERSVDALLRAVIGELQSICAWMGEATLRDIARDQLIRIN
jgi:isopentenyl diphosphate isomerase/L-lactate dehydrogenase-like FMN-dependent dehydrogenase